ncbi:MAG: hypothetical protein QM639_18880 [Rhodocyclaceae bacterium]
MSVSRPEWPWFLAEYVVAEVRQGQVCSYSIHSYLIKSGSPDGAYEKAVNLAERLGDTVRNEDGAVIEYHCKGLFNLDALQMETLEDETHLSVIALPSGTSPQIRSKNELSLFCQPR